MRLRVADLDHDPVAKELVFRQWSELCVRYGVPRPCGEDEAMPTGSFREPIGVFLVGDEDGVAVACGGVRPCQEAIAGVGEIKRMYVDPAARGRGLGRVLLAALEDEGRRLGYERLWLETGVAQPEALRLYETSGWTPIPKYGEYKEEEGCRCFELVVSAAHPSESSQNGAKRSLPFPTGSAMLPGISNREELPCEQTTPGRTGRHPRQG